MAETIYTYSAGGEAGSYWTNESNAWDNIGGTVASRNILGNKTFDNESSKWIKSTTNNAPASGGTITKVEIGIKAYALTPNRIKLRLVPVFGGSSDGDNHDSAYITGSSTTYYYEITTDTNNPGTWTWSDVQGVDIRLWCSNDTNFGTPIYLDQFYIKVTYSTGWTGKINGVTNPAKINGIAVANIKSVNGVE